MRYEIRELSIGSVLDHAIALFVDHYKLILKLACVLMIPLDVAFSVARDLLAPHFVGFGPFLSTFDESPISPQEILWGNVLNLLEAIISVQVAAPLTAGAIIYGIGSEYLDKRGQFWDALRYSFRMCVRLIFGTLLVAILVGLGTMLCIVPGIYLTLLWFVFQPVLILENVGIGEAMGRSAHLMKGSMWQALILILVLQGIALGLVVCGAFFQGRFVGTALFSILGTVIHLFNSIVAMVFYFSARCKREALDLDLLADAVAAQRAREAEVVL
ncbi:MAG: hypothetical protein HY706_19310 [Candidatus Hydrogenedentes bacterium]|nr:hypothetical protein [Candidatus Hydrogenedentota bacterium]